MSHRQTSITAYHQIKSEGLLGRHAFQVYQVLFKHGPLTGRETFQRIGHGFTTHTGARLTELRDAGVVSEVGHKICSVTGRRVILWDVTSKLPKKKIKKKKEICQHCNGTGYELNFEDLL